MTANLVISNIFHALVGVVLVLGGIFCLIEFALLLANRKWRGAMKSGFAALALFGLGYLGFDCVIEGDCPSSPPLGRYWPRAQDYEKLGLEPRSRSPSTQPHPSP